MFLGPKLFDSEFRKNTFKIQDLVKSWKYFFNTS